MNFFLLITMLCLPVASYSTSISLDGLEFNSLGRFKNTYLAYEDASLNIKLSNGYCNGKISSPNLNEIKKAIQFYQEKFPPIIKKANEIVREIFPKGQADKLIQHNTPLNLHLSLDGNDNCFNAHSYNQIAAIHLPINASQFEEDKNQKLLHLLAHEIGHNFSFSNNHLTETIADIFSYLILDEMNVFHRAYSQKNNLEIFFEHVDNEGLESALEKFNYSSRDMLILKETIDVSNRCKSLDYKRDHSHHNRNTLLDYYKAANNKYLISCSLINNLYTKGGKEVLKNFIRLHFENYSFRRTGDLNQLISLALEKQIQVIPPPKKKKLKFSYKFAKIENRKRYRIIFKVEDTRNYAGLLLLESSPTKVPFRYFRNGATVFLQKTSLTPNNIDRFLLRPETALKFNLYHVEEETLRSSPVEFTLPEDFDSGVYELYQTY